MLTKEQYKFWYSFRKDTKDCTKMFKDIQCCKNCVFALKENNEDQTEIQFNQGYGCYRTDKNIRRAEKMILEGKSIDEIRLEWLRDIYPDI